MGLLIVRTIPDKHLKAVRPWLQSGLNCQRSKLVG
jgi:hypothetical protein